MRTEGSLPPARVRGARWYAARIGLMLAVVVLGGVLLQLSDPSITPPDDFVCFWAAGRVNAAGGNPYDAEQILRVQRLANWTADHAYRVWYPPWALPLLTPFAALPYRYGRFCWFVLHLGLLIAATDGLWRLYGGEPRRRGLAWLIGFSFVPSIFVWRTGQMATFVLIGLVGFLSFERRGRLLAAGAMLALAAIKPHLLHLMWIAAVLWMLRERRWRCALGALATGGALLIVAVALNPRVVGDFLRASVSAPPYQAASTVGTVLRLLAIRFIGQDQYWLLFVAPVAGAVWLLGYWRAHRESWDWAERLPIILLVSLATAPFAWVYDEVILLVPVMQIAAGIAAPRSAAVRFPGVVGTYVAIIVFLIVMNRWQVDPFWYVWSPFAFLAWYTTAAAVVPIRVKQNPVIHAFSPGRQLWQ